MKKWKPKSEEDFAEGRRRGQIMSQQKRLSEFRIAKTPPPPLKFKRMEEDKA